MRRFEIQDTAGDEILLQKTRPDRVQLTCYRKGYLQPVNLNKRKAIALANALLRAAEDL